MTDVLSRIVERKRGEVSSRLSSPVPAEPTRRSLRAALARPGARFIMEVKRRSPSGHVARHSVADSVRAYAKVADAISVLTDGEDFGGSLDDLRTARRSFDGPILAKDFIVDWVQVGEARSAGADAILVMMSVLDDQSAASILAGARSLSMDAIVEVHDEDELGRALALGAEIVGINNRDLKTLRTDLAVTERLASKVPGDVLVISESGIRSRDDVFRLARQADAFLVGSSLMAAPDIHQAARALVFGRVKICGLTRIKDVALAAEAGATHAGFIFHPASKRRIGIDQARLLVGAARNCGLASVGVFDGADAAIADTCRSLGLDAAQVHGPVEPRLRERLEGRTLIKAHPVSEGALGTLPVDADHLLFDSGEGGTGETFDWRAVAGHPALPAAFVAGGIGPHNAMEASRLGAHAIDLSSGIESAPRIKDRDKMTALFDQLRPRSRGEFMRQSGRFGRFGGAYVPEILVPAIEQLEAAFLDAQDDADFQAELAHLLATYAGRPTPLTLCRNLSNGGTRIYLKREDLLHGGAHKTNQVLGQALLAKRMGKTRLIAETGAGQHGVATALAGALFGFETRIYMGADDVERQQLNVFRMELMGAEVVPVTSGGRTLKDAVNEALRDWTASFADTHYLLGTVAGPHPFPLMVREYQRVIGREAREQIIAIEGRLPDSVIACVGGGSNAIGIFTEFIDDASVELIGVEAAGKGLNGREHGATLLKGRPGILHGAETLVLMDDDGQIDDTWSVSAGLDYPAVGPEHAHLRETGRATYVGATDAEAIDAFVALARGEGIIGAFESCHALAHALKLAAAGEDRILLVNLSGRGDKDMAQAQRLLAEQSR